MHRRGTEKSNREEDQRREAEKRKRSQEEKQRRGRGAKKRCREVVLRWVAEKRSQEE